MTSLRRPFTSMPVAVTESSIQLCGGGCPQNLKPPAERSTVLINVVNTRICPTRETSVEVIKKRKVPTMSDPEASDCRCSERKGLRRGIVQRRCWNTFMLRELLREAWAGLRDNSSILTATPERLDHHKRKIFITVSKISKTTKNAAVQPL